MICENCSSNHDGSYGSGRFCSVKCARGFSTKHNREEINKKVSKTLTKGVWVPREKQCLYCGNTLKKSSKLFCSCACQTTYNYLIYINKWLLGLVDERRGKYSISKHIRRFLYELNKASCEECGWRKVNTYTGNIPLEIHHVDGDYRNNWEENLKLLCPSCHSLTGTYGSLNKNCTKQNTDKKRKEY